MSQFEQSEYQINVQIEEICCRDFVSLTNSYREAALKKTAVYEWFSRFWDEQESLEDEHHSGRPSTSRNKEMVEQVK